jgi:hypothetical protein
MNTVESKLDLQYDKIKQNEQRFNEIYNQKNELVFIFCGRTFF